MRRRCATDADRIEVPGHEGVPEPRHFGSAIPERFRRRRGLEVDPPPPGHQARRSRWTMYSPPATMSTLPATVSAPGRSPNTKNPRIATQRSFV